MAVSEDMIKQYMTEMQSQYRGEMQALDTKYRAEMDALKFSLHSRRVWKWKVMIENIVRSELHESIHQCRKVLEVVLDVSGSLEDKSPQRAKLVQVENPVFVVERVGVLPVVSVPQPQVASAIQVGNLSHVQFEAK